MLNFRVLVPCFVAWSLFLGEQAIAASQGALERRAAPSTAESQPALPRMTQWLRAGARSQQPGRKIFEVPVGESSTGFVTLDPLSEGPTPLLPPGMEGTAVLARLFVPSTGFFEVFLLYVPPTDPAEERPLLTGFHSYGSSHGTVATLTTFLREAEDREWFLVAPIQSGGPGLAQVSYGSPQSQEHVEAVLGLLLDYYAIDRDRLYGVGFSMGGGSAMGYAARHRDRRKGAFAAVMNHTGTVSLSDTYRFVPPSVQTVMETLFSGEPSQNPFDWNRASSIVLDSASQLVQGADHMAINLTSMPVKTIYGLSDPNEYLIEQSIQLDQFFAGVGATNHVLEPTPVDPATCTIGHCWDTADETAVCDWLESFTLNSNPSSGNILTDRPVRWGRYDVEPDAAGVLTHVEFNLNPTANSVKLLGVRNLREIGFDATRLGLNYDTTITLQIDSQEAGGDDYRLRSFPSLPLLMIRDGQQVAASCTPTQNEASWCFDANTGDLVIHEPGAAGSTEWRISP